MRLLVDLPDSQVLALAVVCEQTKQPRAAVIRDAVAEYLDRHASKSSDDAFGLWGADAEDGLAYQYKVRNEW